ncbi:Mss4-like protein [Aspergillus novoparasiticus]|uniref:Translationally-controlled tumor protein homolog n=1 Tax=Aspergillus novoparasiticus TaxID=986946 RepID=A0A5N6EXW3_9EURO|nr:Mss4-like protein [Aspergillus novoparasiticus]
MRIFTFLDSEDEADPSEEEHDSQDDDAITADNLVRTFQLEETKFDKKEYDSLKEVQAFQKASAEYAKKIAPNWRSPRYFTRASLDPNGMVVLSGYREDGVTQYFIFWKDGLRTTDR